MRSPKIDFVKLKLLSPKCLPIFFLLRFFQQFLFSSTTNAASCFQSEAIAFYSFHSIYLLFSIFSRPNIIKSHVS